LFANNYIYKPFLLNSQAQGTSGKNEKPSQRSWRGSPEAWGPMQLHQLHQLKAGPDPYAGGTTLRWWCWRRWPLLAIPALGSYCERIEYNLTCLSFASFYAPYNPVCLMYEKQLAFKFWYCAL